MRYFFLVLSAEIYTADIEPWNVSSKTQSSKDVLKLTQTGRIFPADVYDVVIVGYFNWSDIIQVRSDRKAVPLQRGMQAWSYC